jgi:ComF family protein
MNPLTEITESVLHLFFPHICVGCGTDLLDKESTICIRCMDTMPETQFELHTNNPVEKLFAGRVNLVAASAQFYFTKESLMQRLIHQFKYKNNKELGWQLGKIMGHQLKRSNRFYADALIPLPLFPAKERKRGYNQAKLLCQGIAESLSVPILDNVVIRPHHTETQTRKGRIERWINMEGKFIVQRPELIQDKHILLIDDVVTTGATLESCGNELLAAENVRLSIATLCTSS